MWEALIGFFIAPFVFWGMMFLGAVFLIAASESKNLWLAFWVVLFGGALALTKFDSFGSSLDYVKEHPWELLVILFAYMLMGTLWSLFKWYIYVQDYAKQKRLYPIYYAEKTLSVHNEKDKIVTWIILWPPSMLWFLINDPIRRLRNWIYDSLQRVYQGIADRALGENK